MFEKVKISRLDGNPFAELSGSPLKQTVLLALASAAGSPLKGLCMCSTCHELYTHVRYCKTASVLSTHQHFRENKLALSETALPLDIWLVRVCLEWYMTVCMEKNNLYADVALCLKQSSYSGSR